MADWNKLNENDFENLLKNSLNDIPPQNIIDEVSPYKDAIGHIVWGIGLTTITLNFLLPKLYIAIYRCDIDAFGLSLA